MVTSTLIFSIELTFVESSLYQMIRSFQHDFVELQTDSDKDIILYFSQQQQQKSLRFICGQSSTRAMQFKVYFSAD